MKLCYLTLTIPKMTIVHANQDAVFCRLPPHYENVYYFHEQVSLFTLNGGYDECKTGQALYNFIHTAHFMSNMSREGIYIYYV